MIIAIPFALNYAGGWSSVTANIEPGTLSMFKGYDVFGIISLVVMYTATFSVGQEAVSRFYAAKDEKAAKGGAWLAALVNFIYAFVPTILGIITARSTWEVQRRWCFCSALPWYGYEPSGMICGHCLLFISMSS
ncbi:MAG: hypothetical protein ACLT69_05295 [Intestinibacter bartlettii]